MSGVLTFLIKINTYRKKKQLSHYILNLSKYLLTVIYRPNLLECDAHKLSVSFKLRLIIYLSVRLF